MPVLLPSTGMFIIFLLEDGWDLELVVPERLSFPSGIKKADPPEKGDPEIHYLLLKGTNPRSYHFEGLIELLNEKKPGLHYSGQ